jgi:protein-tyrosine-phosphatase
MSKLAQQGFLTIAQNTDIDYLRLAYVQAMSVKGVMPGSKYAVLVDEATAKQVTNQHRKVFDYVITLPEDHAKLDQWKLANEWQVFNLTPFKETIKLEADLLFTRSIEHWWTAFRLRDVVLSLGCRDYQSNISSCREYRKLFDDNNLPDTYNGLMYFRYSQTSYNFFNIARSVYEHWTFIRDSVLKNCRDEKPTTDLVYAIVANTLGVENCTLLKCDFINFTHMKSAINGWPNRPWPELVISETDLPMVRINNVNQYHPLHYQEKSWITDEVVERYERCLQN